MPPPALAAAPAPAPASDDTHPGPVDAPSSSLPSPQQLLLPPAKRVRRDYPWRTEYEREFGVRPIQVDAATGDAVLVECRFCVSFGREPPAALVALPVNKNGQPIKSRARTRNVAHWKYPFRTDNMRSHHLQQHAQKWTEYTALLEQTRQQKPPQGLLRTEPRRGEDAEDHDAQEASSAHRLHAFFGEFHEDGVGATPVAAPAVSTAPSLSTRSSSVAVTATSTTTESVLLPTVTNTAIVDTVLPALVTIPSGDAEERASTNTLLVPVKSKTSGMDEDAVVTHYSIASGPATDLHGIVRLLEAGLSFRQVAEVAPALCAGEATVLARTDVVEYARALVASGLERVAQVVAAAWTYSLRLTVHAPPSDQVPAALRVSVRVPVEQSRSVEEFHVVMLALRQTSESTERVGAFLRAVLAAIDQNWHQKQLSVIVDGATHCLGVHADLAERGVGSQLSEPVLAVFDGRQDIEHAVQTAWALHRDQGKELAPFTHALLQIVASIRADSEVVAAHHHCPLVQLHDARSVMRALMWLLPRRDALAKSDIHAPLWWWLAAHIIVELWTDCLVATADTLKGPQRFDRDRSRGTIVQLVKALTTKCGIVANKERDAGDKTSDVLSPIVDYSEKARVASLRVPNSGSRLVWTTKDIAHCLRGLNVSTRRLLGELSKDAPQLQTMERHVSRFALLLVSQLQQCTAVVSRPTPTSSDPAPPPTLPLDFAAIDTSSVVDFVETHSRRLERAFPAVLLDLASREIRDLQTFLATNTHVCSALERIAEQPTLTCFTESWALVPQYPAVRTLAAGLRTAMPGPTAEASSAVAFSRAENDETPCAVLADLALEAHMHARQLRRLQRASADASRHHESLVV